MKLVKGQKEATAAIAKTKDDAVKHAKEVEAAGKRVGEAFSSLNDTIQKIAIHGTGSGPLANDARARGRQVIHFRGDYAGAMNIYNPRTGDIIGSTPVDMLATAVFDYCQKHPNDLGNDAVIHVLVGNLNAAEEPQ